MGNAKKRRIGIMGGTFDPIHNAHLALAQRAYEQFALDCVWLLPNGNPPHKRDRKQADVDCRMEMVRLAIEGIPYLELCELERCDQGYHYTYETLRILNENWSDTQFYFILGADSLFDFEQWREPAVISRECVLLAATRDCDRARIEEKIRELQAEFGADVRILDTPNMDVSSEAIRDRIGRGERITELVPAPVEEYIRRTGLYGREAHA